MLWSKGCTLRIRREQGRIELIRFTTFVINRRWIDHRHATRTWNEYRVRSHDQHSDSLAHSRWWGEHGFAFHVLHDFENPFLGIRVILHLGQKAQVVVRIQLLHDLLLNLTAVAFGNGVLDVRHSSIGALVAIDADRGHVPRLLALVKHIASRIALLLEQRQWVAAEGAVVAADSLAIAEVFVRPRQSIAVPHTSRSSTIFIIAFVGAFAGAVPRHMRALLSAVAIPNGTVADEIREGHRDEQRGAECVHRRIGVES